MIQLLLYKLNPTIKYIAYLCLQLKESLAVNAYLGYLFVTRYTCLYIYEKPLLAGIISRIIG